MKKQSRMGKETIQLGKKSQPLTHVWSVGVVGSGGLESDEECAPMFGGAVQERIACGIGRIVEEQGTFNWRGDGNSMPRMLLHPALRGWLIKSKLTERFDEFALGEWV